MHIAGESYRNAAGHSRLDELRLSSELQPRCSNGAAIHESVRHVNGCRGAALVAAYLRYGRRGLPSTRECSDNFDVAADPENFAVLGQQHRVSGRVAQMYDGLQ